MTTVGQRVLERAVARLGEDEVVARLGISKASLHAYLTGYRAMSDRLLLLAIDLALESETAPECPKRR